MPVVRHEHTSNERGTSESLQWAILMPLLILVVIGGIQSAIWLHGRTLAAEAAAAAAETAAAANGSAGAADAVARRIASPQLRDLQVQVTDTGADVVVRIDARTQTFLDLGQGRVHVTASQPKEPRG